MLQLHSIPLRSFGTCVDCWHRRVRTSRCTGGLRHGCLSRFLLAVLGVFGVGRPHAHDFEQVAVAEHPGPLAQSVLLSLGVAKHGLQSFFLPHKFLLLLPQVLNLRTQLFAGGASGSPCTKIYSSSGGLLITGGGSHEPGNNRRARGIGWWDEVAAALDPNTTAGGGPGTSWSPVGSRASSSASLAGVRLRVPLLSRPAHTAAFDAGPNASASNASASGGGAQS